MIELSKIPVYLKACRPWSFPLSMFPVLLGVICSEHKLVQKWQVVFGFAAASVLVIHAAANLCNTYWDYTLKVRQPITLAHCISVHSVNITRTSTYLHVPPRTSTYLHPPPPTSTHLHVLLRTTA